MALEIFEPLQAGEQQSVLSCQHDEATPSSIVYGTSLPLPHPHPLLQARKNQFRLIAMAYTYRGSRRAVGCIEVVLGDVEQLGHVGFRHIVS